MLDNQTFLMAMALLVGLTLSLVATFAGVATVLVWWIRRSGKKVKSATEPTGASTAPKTPVAAPPPPPKDITPVVPSSPPAGDQKSPKPVAEPGHHPLMGVFDDGKAAQPREAASTELFQRGAGAFEWLDHDDDSEEEEGATEVFSAHHLEELGEFNIKEDD